MNVDNAPVVKTNNNYDGKKLKFKCGHAGKLIEKRNYNDKQTWIIEGSWASFQPLKLRQTKIRLPQHYIDLIKATDDVEADFTIDCSYEDLSLLHRETLEIPVRGI